jgi:hypothetical protein
MSEPETNNTRAITPPRASQHNATDPGATTAERVRQVELNRLRGKYSLSPQPYPLFLFLVPSLTRTTRQPFRIKPKQDDANKKKNSRLLLILILPPRCAIPTTKDPSPSSPQLPILRLARRITTITTTVRIPAVVKTKNYSVIRVLGSTLTMIYQRWSIRKVVSSSRMMGEQTMI